MSEPKLDPEGVVRLEDLGAVVRGFLFVSPLIR